jgi:single-stranded DNA-binding protein
MAKPINQFTLSGKIVSGIELRKTNNKEIPVCNFRLMHNAPQLRNPVYVDVEVWGKEAENLAINAYKHSFVVIHGELRRDVWQAENGDPRSKLKLTASRVIIDDTRKIVDEAIKNDSQTNISF